MVGPFPSPADVAVFLIEVCHDDAATRRHAPGYGAGKGPVRPPFGTASVHCPFERMTMRSICLCLFSLVLTTAAHAACDDTKARSFEAARGQRYDDALALIAQLGKEPTCDAKAINGARQALAAYLVQKAVEAGDSRPYRPSYVDLIQKAESLNAYWQASARLGDMHVASRRFGDAAASYQKAVNLLETSQKPVSDPERRYVVKRAEETRQLAAERGNGDNRAIFVAMVKTARGETGGEYGAAAGRGIVGDKVPTPIVFEFNSDQFTPEGAQYAAELLDVLKHAEPTHVTVTGHTDQRGSDDYNMTLSARRAQAVARYLEDGGLKVTYRVVARGKRDPRVLTDPSIYTPEEIDMLNRRVEASWGQ
jgi:outer membrane protein OmpA-like peptidoglycan-associated protein